MAKSFKVLAPKLSRDLPEAVFESKEEVYYNRCMFKDCHITGDEIERIICDDVIFKNVTFEAISFHKADLLDCVFDQCDLSNADFSEGSIHRVEFRDSKLMGSNFSDSTLENVLFDECMNRLSTFGFAKLKQVRFQNTALTQADFYECKLQKTAFDSCDIDGVNFANTPLKGVDISTSTFQDLQVTLSSLPGCIVTEEQALSFARVIGIEIKD